MKIGFYLENQNISGIDFRDPRSGNPGCGATQFLFSALPYYLAAYDGCCPIIFANHINRLPENIPNLRVDGILHAIRRAKKEGCDFFVYRLTRHPDPEFLALLESLQLPTVIWAHLHPTGPQIRALARSAWVRAIVCAGREQHDFLRDTPAWRKLTCIVNGFDLNGYRLTSPPATEPNLVVYLGALVPQKGFHVLALAWKRILRRCPKARLAVIGSAELYDTSARLGSWGVAAPRYERCFVPYLVGEDGRPHPSVTFLGKLGGEKKEMLCKAAVGVVNPSGRTEVCPISPLEFQACGTPVVSGSYYGLLDTVRHGHTGLLGRTENDLVANICGLLEDPPKAQVMGRSGFQFVRDHHDFETIAGKWMDLFECLMQEKPPPRVPPKRNLHRHHKFLVAANRPFQMALGRIVTWPSVMEAKFHIANLFRARSLLTSEKS